MDKPMNPFLRLPTELTQHIAYLLPTNADVIRFALCSSDLAAKILPSESHIWRRLFQDTYDDHRSRTLVEYKIEYQVRSIVLSREIDFRYGQKERQTFWLDLLKDMMTEVLFRPENMDSHEVLRNLNRIQESLVNSEFLNRPVSGYMMRKPDPPSNMFCAVQLALTYMVLDPSMSVRCLRNDYDIEAVYLCPGTEKRGFFDNFSVSSETALDIRNFWLRHLLNPDEGTFYSSYASLPEHHRPGLPKRYTYDDKPQLFPSWLGYESCICPLPATIPDLELRQTCADLNGHMVEVEHITLHLEEHPDPENWPDLFEDFISPFSNIDKNLLFRGSQTYHGSGGNRISPIRGFLERVYGGGLPGWCRICFVTYERPPHLLFSQGGGTADPNTNTTNNNNNQRHQRGTLFDESWPPLDMLSDFTSIYAYEGVVVPGFSLIVGHWSDVAAGLASGPFIFWCI